MVNQFKFSYSIFNHLTEGDVVIKNRLGMNIEVPYQRNDNPREEGNLYLNIKFKIIDIRSIKLNEDMVSNEFDRHIFKVLKNKIDEIFKVDKNLLSLPGHRNDIVTITVKIADMNCNYRYNSFQSDFLGITLELKRDAGDGFYRQDDFKDIVKENDDIDIGEKNKRDYLIRIYKIIDNNKQIGDLWVKMPGEICKIYSTVDESKSDGIYIYDGNRDKVLTVITPNNITKETLANYGIAMTKIELESVQYSKEKAEFKKTINKLKDELRAKEDIIVKLNNNTLGIQLIVGELKSKFTIIKEMMKLSERQNKLDLQEIKFTQTVSQKEQQLRAERERQNNLQNGVKTASDLLSFVVKIVGFF